ncbi:restriction endonuclease subunit S [Sphingorhabdus sp. M41]|uniref:restriction endonuclease subunit S n=1 Tax=Sphingorhabdus sp. M41 TaxID=1806885 RepID=UPI00078E0C9C|nr:restriction endonuclease subunit S [Sphingorhabdus sp. M41]AMO72955.1 restriction endonuclease [Sphingorhabdus sp. M41]
MSDLSFLNNLLDGAEVEWKPLGDVAKVQRGASPRPISKFITDDPDGVPWIKIGDTEPGSKYVTKTAQKITAGGAEKSRRLSKGDFIISNSMSFGRPYILALDGAIHDGWASVSDYQDALNSDFLYHYLSSHAVQSYWLTKINSGSVSNLNSQLIQALEVPIPCPKEPEKSLAIQAEIVRILESFTELTAELTAELAARKKQYNHYREELFCFDDSEAEFLALGDERIGSFTRGGGLQKKDFVEQGVGCIHYGQIYTHYGTFARSTKSYVSDDFAKKARKAKKGDLVIATTSENDDDVCKAVAWLGEEDIAVSSDACFYSHNLNPKYVSYFFQTEQFQKQKRAYITGTKVRRVNADSLAKIEIPVPHKEGEQERIVVILDKFDTLTTSLSEGLPREIALRQQQYEYYRHLLLSFPKAAQAVEA